MIPVTLYLYSQCSFGDQTVNGFAIHSFVYMTLNQQKIYRLTVSKAISKSRVFL